MSDSQSHPLRSSFQGRHQARQYAMDLVFEAEARAMTPLQAAHLRKELAKHRSDITPPSSYTMTLVQGVTTSLHEIDHILTQHLQSWTLERLPAVDRAILRIAIWELLYGRDVPDAVVVDEAVQIAKEFSTDESPGFINGVLGQIMLLSSSEQVHSSSPDSTMRTSS